MPPCVPLRAIFCPETTSLTILDHSLEEPLARWGGHGRSFLSRIRIKFCGRGSTVQWGKHWTENSGPNLWAYAMCVL